MHNNILKATRAGDVKQLKQLIKDGHPIDIRDNNGWCALHEASSRNHLKCLKVLVSHAPSLISCISFDQTSPLLISARENHLDCLELLLQNGADPNISDHLDQSPLHSAVTKNNINMALQLLSKKANVNAKTYDGSSPLYLAIEEKSFDMAKLLLDHGADITAVDENGINPFFKAAELGLLECLELFIKVLGEALTRDEVLSVVNAVAFDGCTPLFIATQHAREDCVQFLLDSGADANLPVHESQYLPLHIALDKNYIKLIQLLLPITNEEAIYKCACSPFYYTFRNDDDLTAINLLIRHGFDISRSSQVNIEINCFFLDLFDQFRNLLFAPLAQALLMRAPVYCKLLIEKGARINSSEDCECPPILVALIHNNLSLASCLIKIGASVNVYISPYSFNLSLFAPDCPEVVSFILRCGAEVDSLFLERSVNQILELLLQANKDQKDFLTANIAKFLYVSSKSNFPEVLMD